MSRNVGDKDIKTFSSFDREMRTEKYRADEENENILETINRELAGVDEKIASKLQGKPRPTLLITGAPRSGTTIISQLLPARYNFGYVSNLMARFYGSPLAGAWLQKQLIPNDIQSIRDFRNHHGTTENICEPHEFGYFWSQYLFFGSDCHEPKDEKELAKIDFSALQKILSEISVVFDKPLVSKCTISPFLIESFIKHTDVFFIHIKRDRAAAINSIIKVREQRLGDVNKWWSIRPYGWSKLQDKSPEEQVAWQYDTVVNSIRSGLESTKDRGYEVQLEELVKNPERVLQDIVNAYSKYSGVSVAAVGDPVLALEKGE